MRVVAIALIATLWWRSKQHVDTVLFFGPRAWVQGITSASGVVQVAFSNVSAGSAWAWTVDFDTHRDTVDWTEGNPYESVGKIVGAGYEGNQLANAHGFGAGVADKAGNEQAAGDAVFVFFPHWVPLSLTSAWWLSAMPGVLRSRRRRRRLRKGLCGHCGYDLRESAGRCPECGRVSGGLMVRGA